MKKIITITIVSLNVLLVILTFSCNPLCMDDLFQTPIPIQDPTPPPTNAIPGLLAYYPFNGNTHDESGNDFHGVNYGATLTKDRFGNPDNAYSFDGTDYMKIFNYQAFNNLPGFTIAAWVKPMAYKERQVIISKVDPNRDFSLMIVNEGGVTVGFAHSAVYYRVFNSDPPVLLNEWTHVAGVWNGTCWKIYLNGVFIISSDDFSVEPLWTGESLQIGALLDSTEGFEGSIDEVRIYDIVLSDEDIEMLVLPTPAPTPDPIPTPNPTDKIAGLLAYYPFNGNTNDESGNDFHGVNYGATLTEDRFGNPDNAYSFDGTDFMKITDYQSFNNLPGFTIAAWVKPATYNGDHVIISKVYPNRDFVLSIGNEGRVNVAFAHNTDYYRVTHYDPAIPLNEWTHVAGVWNGMCWKIYLNGVFIISSDDFSVEPLWTGESLQIGALLGSTEGFEGSIDEVRIYDIVLSDEDIGKLVE